jgi:hypothetical protein
MELAYTSRNDSRNPAAFEGVLQQLKTSAGVMIGKMFALPHLENGIGTMSCNGRSPPRTR